MALWLQDLYLWLRFSSEAASLLVTEQGLDNSEKLRVLTDKNVDDICNVMRKPGCKNANRTLDRGQKVLVIAQENQKIAVSLFYHQKRCTFDWEVMGVHEDTLCLLDCQKRFEDEC